MKKIFMMLFSMLVFTVSAESVDGAWRFSAGPAWRSQVKASISGNVSATPIVPSHTASYDKDVAGRDTWDIADVITVPDPAVDNGYAPPGSTLYAVEAILTERTVMASDSTLRFADKDDDSLFGFRAGVGYDFYDDGDFTIGLDLKFAAFWNMKAAVAGAAGGGTVRVQTMKDYFLFENGPYPNDVDFSYSLPNTDPYLPYREGISDITTLLPSSKIRAMVTSDLYQIGIGPRLGWRLGDWFDAYAGASVLCNIMSVDFAVGGQGESAIECSFGAGAEIGLVAWLGDNFGIYAEAGYEWIDATKVRNGGLAAEMDYSSLIVSVGCVFRF